MKVDRYACAIRAKDQYACAIRAKDQYECAICAKDQYECAIRAKDKFFDGWKTVGHIPREISRHVYYFIKTEGGSVTGTVISTKHRPSPIPSGGLEIPLLLKFSCSQQKTFEKMKTFIQTLYDYNFTGTVKEEDSSDEEDETVTISMADDSKPDDQLKQLVSYTASESTKQR